MKMNAKVLRPEGHFEIGGLCNQIAEGGAGAIITDELTLGETVLLRLILPSETETISMRAVVRWRDRLQHGFEFLGTKSEQREKIIGYCKALSSTSPPGSKSLI